MLKISQSANPSIPEVVDAIRSAEGRHIRFEYANQRPPKALTACELSRREDTRHVEYGAFQGWLTLPDKPTVFYKTKDGRWIFTFRPSTVRKALPKGEGYYAEHGDMTRGEYLYRSFMPEGIRPGSLEVSTNKGRIKLFPNAK